MSLHIKVNSPKGKSWELDGIRHLAVDEVCGEVHLLFRPAPEPDGWGKLYMSRGSEITLKIKPNEDD